MSGSLCAESRRVSDLCGPRTDDFTGPDASFESILSRLSSYFYVESDDALLRWIRKTLRVKGLREKMKAWRTEWQGFVRDGTSEGRIS